MSKQVKKTYCVYYEISGDTLVDFVRACAIVFKNDRTIFQGEGGQIVAMFKTADIINIV